MLYRNYIKFRFDGGFMIRDFKAQDIDSIMELWLKANNSAHSFIDEEYWTSNFDTVKKMMPNATIYIYTEKDIIQGFIGLIDGYIAGIFVSNKMQSKGIGSKLLNYAKANYDTLCLMVYKKNDRAVHFYLREGFYVSNEQIDENTGEFELSMHWIK